MRILQIFVFFSLALTSVYGQNGPGGVGNSDGSNSQPELLFWLSADSLTLNNSDPVSVWNDISGNGRDFQQAASSNQPTYLNNGINTIPTVNFDGVDDFLEDEDAEDYINGLSGISVIAVVQSNETESDAGFFDTEDPDGADDLLAIRYDDAGASGGGDDVMKFGLNTSSGNTSMESSALIQTTSPQMLTLQWSSGGPLNLYENGTLDTPTSPSANLSGTIQNTAKALIGKGPKDASDGWNGYVSEMILVGENLSQARRNIIENYLSEKYNLSIANDLLTSLDAAYKHNVAGIGEEADGEHTTSASGGLYLTALSGLGVGDYVFSSHNNLTNNSSNFRTGSEITVTGAVEAYNRTWYVEKVNTPTARVSFDFSDALEDGLYPTNYANYVLLYRSGTTGDFSKVKNADGIENGDQVYFDLNDAQLQSGYYTLGTEDDLNSPLEGISGRTWYTLISGDWDDWETWTLDPSGALPNNPNGYTPTTSPTSAADNVVILTGRTVTVSSNSLNNASLVVDGRLDLQTTSGHSFGEISGTGRILLAGDNFPSGDATHFYTKGQGEGTVEYYGGNYTLSTAREFYDVEIELDNSANILKMAADYTINGNLYVTDGVLQINDETNTTPLTIDVAGDVLVDNETATGKQGEITVSSADAYSSGAQTGYGNYHKGYHVLRVGGNFTNNNSVRLTNLTNPDYNSRATDGAVSLVFYGASNKSLSCYGTTDLYNLVIDKGSGRTYELQIYADNKAYFSLFGQNNLQWDATDPANPEMRKALWIKNGTLTLKGNVYIPSLTEGSRDYTIGKNASLKLAGDNVFVGNTANEATSWADLSHSGVPDGVDNGGSNQGLYILGKLQVDDGHFYLGEAEAINFRDEAAGIIEVNGGLLETNQIAISSSASLGNFSFLLNGGEVRITREYGGDNGNAMLNLDTQDMVFSMTGGALFIEDVTGHSPNAIHIASTEGNYNVTGGTVYIDVNTTATVRSTAPFYNLQLNSGSNLVLEENLTVLGDLNIQNTATLTASGFDVYIGDDFDLADGGSYLHGGNTTHFIGDRASYIYIRNTDTENYLLLNNLVLSKDQRYNTSLFHAVEIRSGGSRANTLSPLLIEGDITINRGEFDVNEWLVHLHGNIEVVDGQILATDTPAGRIVLNGATQQTLKGSFTKEQAFGSFELDNAGGAKLLSDINVQDFTLTQGVMDLDVYNLDVGGIVSTTGTFDENLMFRTAGNASDGGLTRFVDLSEGVADTELLFPLGTGTDYNPARVIQRATITDVGRFTINPVNSTHPSATKPTKTIPYYWLVDTSGFSSLNYDQIRYTFTYNGGSIPGSVNKGLNLWPEDYTWYSHNGVVNGSDLEFPYGAYLREDFTIGNKSEFNQPIIYYSRVVSQNYNIGGMPQWSDGNTWSTESHTGAAAGAWPQDGDIAIIGYGGTGGGSGGNRHHVAYRTTDNYAPAKVIIDASEEAGVWNSRLFIEDGATFNMGVVDGDGTLQILLNPSSPSTITGDFGNFTNNYADGARILFLGVAGTNLEIPDIFNQYPNVRLEGGGNRTFFFPDEALVLGELRVDHDATLRVEHDLTVNGDLRLGNYHEGILEFPDDVARTVTVHSDLRVTNDNASAVIVDNSTPNNLEHYLRIAGNINLTQGNKVDLFSNNTGGNNVILELFGETDKEFNNTDGMPVDLYRIIMNKLSGKDFLFNDAFTLNGPTDSDPKALELISGRLMLSDPGIDITLSSGGPDFKIPSLATLYTGQSATVRITGDNTGIWLDGHIHAGWDTKWYLNGGVNNYIEYTSSGNAEIDIYQAEFYVGSHIRRSTTTEEGILRFQQNHANSTVVIGTNADQGGDPDRGVFEIVNTGSYFSQVADAEMTIANAVPNSTAPSFYLALSDAEVSLGDNSLLRFGSSQTQGAQAMDLYASLPLKNITVDNSSGQNPTLQLNTLALTLDSLTIETGAVFDANALDLYLHDDMVANGTFAANRNSTYFIGTSNQAIVGSPVFWNLYKTTTNDLTLNDDVEVANELHLESGTFTDGDNTLSVQGYVWMDVIHNWGGSSEGIVLNGTENQVLTGDGVFGKLTIVNPQGVNLPAGSEFTISGALQLEQGVLNIGKNLLNLTETASIIEGNAFSENNMIQTNISFTDAGVKKFYPAISSATSFIYPIGSKGKYTPVEFNISQMNSGGAIRVKAADEIHPTIVNDDEPCQEIVDTANVLKYHWLVEAINVTGFTAEARMQYYAADFQDNSAFYDERDYIAARLLYGSTLWNKYDETSFDETNQLLRFSFSNTDDNGISGDYTAGVEDPNGTCEGAIPDEVPAYITIDHGNWTDETIWDTYPMPGGTVPAGGPRGAIVIVEHEVTISDNYILNYKTQINSAGVIKVGTTFGHRLGIVEGTGTLQLERGSLPAGIYDNFFSRSGGTLEYTGPDSYDVLSEVTALRNLKFSGTGERRLPNLDFEVYGEFTIAGDDATLEVINEHDRNITLDSTITFTQGSFDAGMGNSRVIINGTSQQVMNGDFSGSNAFWDFEMNNSEGLVLSGAIEIDNNLIFSEGVIQTDAANMLTVDNSLTTAVTGYGNTTYVDGPMQKLVNSGDGFVFPLGDDTRYGWMEIASTLSTSASLWEAEYFNANPSDVGLDTSKFVSPLQAVSGNEYWRVKGPEASSSAFTKIRWDQNSILPAATNDRENNLVMAEWDGGSTQWQSVGEDVVDFGIANGYITSDNRRTLAERYYTLGSKETVPLPTAGFLTADTTICAGSTISLRIQVDGNPDFSVVVDDGTSTNTYSSSTSSVSFDVSPATTITYTIVEVIENTDGTPVSSTTTIWGDPVTVEVIPVPDNSFSITPSGNASYCQGSSGIEVGLDGSESGVTYQLLLNGAPIGSTAAGTGSAISFGMQTVEGTYTVQGTNQGDTNADCARLMSGSLILAENALPVVALSVNPSFDRVCDGDNTEISVDFTGLGPFDFTITNGTTTETVNSVGDDPYTYIPLTAPVWLDDGTPDTEYTYSVTSITDANGCTNTTIQGSAQVTVYKVPETGLQYHISNEHAK